MSYSTCKEEFSFEEFENRFKTTGEVNGPVDLVEAHEEYGESALKEATSRSKTSAPASLMKIAFR